MVDGNLASEERLAWIRARLDADGRIEIAAAADALDVSGMTVRRDLQELEALGLARRVRGGAVAVGPVLFAERHRHRARAKNRIAAKLEAMVPGDGAIGIDASSTLLRLASAIEHGRDLSVLTNGIETFQALQGKPGVTALLTGGQLDTGTGSLVGPVACHAARRLVLRRLFVSAAALDPDLGASEADVHEAEVKRTMAASAAEVVLAVDAGKLGTRAVAVGIELEEVDVLVTDLDPDDDRLDAYRKSVGRIL